MSALELPGRITWVPDLVATSILLGMLLAGASLIVAVRHEGKAGSLWAAVLLDFGQSYRFILRRWGPL